jgi:hypothetical protein
MLCAKVNPQDAFGHSHANGYRAYLVRLWQDGPQADWRASAQSAQTGDTVRFADVDALFAFLLKQMQLDDRTDADDAT